LVKFLYKELKSKTGGIKTRIAVLLLAIMVIISASTGWLALSVKGDLEEIKNQNILVLLLDETSNDVEVAIGIRVGEEPFLVNPEEKVDEVQIKSVFTESVRKGAWQLLGAEVKGFQTLKGVPLEKRAPVNRIVTVETSVIKEVVDSIGGIDFGAGDPEGIYVFKHMSGEETARMLREGRFVGNWTVTIKLPFGGKTTKEVSGKELESLLETFGEKIDPLFVKVAVLAEVAKEVQETLKENKKLMGKVAEIGLASYKEGRIQTYPTNTLTKVIKYIPFGLIRERIL